MKNLRNLSLRTKLKVFMTIMLVPMVSLVLGLIIRFSTYTDQYTPIVKDINIANAFDRSFKEEVDYSMYRVAIGSEAFENTEIRTILERTKVYFKQLERGTSLSVNKKQVRRAERNLALLEKKIELIQQNCEETGHYDENMTILENDVYVFTSLITQEIHEYVYYEALELERVKQQIQQDINEMLRMSLMILMLVLGITWLLEMGISNSISKPLQHLCEITKEVGAGNFSMQKIKGHGDEIATLEESFNKMLGQIEGLMSHVKEEQVHLRKTELKLLQAQINPHFLYNTLDTIMWLAEDGENEKVVEMVGALSNFFRGSLSKGRDYISLAEEERHIKSYLQIQQFRYADLLDYEIQIPEALGDFEILKLTLQPLVENALYHGIKQRRNKGKIKVEGKLSGENLILQVKDNGMGMLAEELQGLMVNLEKGVTTQSGFGLANVNERLKLNYGEAYGLKIKSEYEVGTTVTVSLPARSLHSKA